MTEKLGETCIDGGKCHHKCKEKCFRREHCSPFIDYQGVWAYGEDTHELKTDPHVFQAVIDGKKLFEIRKDDRKFKVGDTLRLRETVYTGSDMKNGKPLEYTGRALVCKVTYALRGPIYGLQDEWVILSIAPVEPNLVVTHSPDANVERNRELLLQRSIAGLAKYGVTTERNDLTLSQWLQHALEEVLDLANYLQAAKTQIERDAHLAREAFEEGFRMRGELDSNSLNGCAWRSVEEAWVNSDVEAKVTK